MSREIKFRGWDKYDKKMIYDLCQIDSFWHYYSYSNNTGLHFGKTGPDGVSEDFKNKYIMQYTGLKDKNGKKIFEGDIVLDEQSGYNYFIKWFPEYTCFALANKNGHIEFGCDELEIFLDDLVVSGNIHDNPELLKGE